MKTIKFLIVIVIILAIIFGVKVLGPKNDEIKTGLTLEEVKEIVAKSENITNYYCEYINPYGEEKFIIKYKDGKHLKIAENSNIIEFKNEETKEKLVIDEQKKVVLKNPESLFENEDTIKMLRNSFEIAVNSSKEYEIKTEEYNNYDCIKIEFKEIINSEEDISEMWIDKKTGVIMKVVSEREGKGNFTMEYNFKINSIKEEDIELDLSGYQIIDASEK